MSKRDCASEFAKYCVHSKRLGNSVASNGKATHHQTCFLVPYYRLNFSLAYATSGNNQWSQWGNHWLSRSVIYDKEECGRSTKATTYILWCCQDLWKGNVRVGRPPLKLDIFWGARRAKMIMSVAIFWWPLPPSRSPVRSCALKLWQHFLPLFFLIFPHYPTFFHPPILIIFSFTFSWKYYPFPTGSLSHLLVVYFTPTLLLFLSPSFVPIHHFIIIVCT